VGAGGRRLATLGVTPAVIIAHTFIRLIGKAPKPERETCEKPS